MLKPGGLLAVRVSALDILRSGHLEFAHERQRFIAHACFRQCEIAVLKLSGARMQIRS